MAPLRLALLAFMVLACAGGVRAGEQPYSSSWIWVDPACNTRVLKSGEPWEVKVEYHLDAADAQLARTLEVFVAGPWIDGPDGKYVKDRQHMNYPGMSRSITVSPGDHPETLRFTIPPAKPQGNALLVIAAFVGEKGRWPWEQRLGGISFVRSDGYFEVTSDKPGNLFTYDEPVEFVAELKSAAPEGKKLTYRVVEPTGATAAEGEVQISAGAKQVKIPVESSSRGIFLLEANIEGWEKREVSFGRIPDLAAITKGNRTLFGMTNVLMPKPKEVLEEECQIAQRLGLSACRIMARWDNLESGPGQYKLEPWLEAMKVGRQYGIDPVLMVDHPPAWVQKTLPKNVQYAPFEADWDLWGKFVESAGKRFKGNLYAWEWLNEIVPGEDPNAVRNYITLCRIGTETAKKADPAVITTAAGGLWPRSFRNDLLAAGLARHVDVLPVHYSDGSGVRQARADVQATGANLEIWDNETSTVLNAWDLPKREQIADRTQPRWLLTHWTEELTAGATRIFWFGGAADPAGNWSYLLGDLTPRPVAVTLAVFTSKLHGVKPLGAFSAGNGSRLHLFEREGKGIVVAWSAGEASVQLAVGDRQVVLSDYLGTESAADVTDGIANLKLTPTPIFIEGADLDLLKAMVMLQSATSEDATQPAQATLLQGRPGELALRLTNPYTRPISGELVLEMPPGWPEVKPLPFELAAGSIQILSAKLSPPATEIPAAQMVASLRPTEARLPAARLPIRLAVVSPDSLGNLLPNGNFEQGQDGKPANWSGSGQWVASATPEIGLGEHVLRFDDTKGAYHQMSNSIRIPGGQTYLYSAWVANQDMQAGSNIGMQMRDGSQRTLYNVQVFVTPPTNPDWQLYTVQLKSPPEMVGATFTPVVKGTGWSTFDNLRVTRYEGTDYMAEASKAASRPTIDGKLDEWAKSCPIPLLNRNQLTVLNASYQWSPESLSGVAYLSWDQENLYLAARVRDDRHEARTSGETTIEGDSLVLAFDPSGRGPEAADKAFCYYISAAPPGGGSGKHTVFRPPLRAAGLSSGHLLKDSSLYDLAVTHAQGVTAYELRIPFSEMGGIRPDVGGRLGLTVSVIDNDGEGPMARMSWGQGVSPSWQPMNFGLVTLLENNR